VSHDFELGRTWLAGGVDRQSRNGLLLLLGTQEIRFGRKMNEIAKFSILDEKTKFTILDEIWTKNGQLIAEPNAIHDRGMSKRPPCAERNLHVGGIFL